MQVVKVNRRTTVVSVNGDRKVLHEIYHNALHYLISRNIDASTAVRFMFTRHDVFAFVCMLERHRLKGR